MKISVIFPCKNQSKKLLANIEKKGLPFFDSLGLTYEFLIVTDGSDEKNEKEMEEGVRKLPLQVKLLPFERKLGKVFWRRAATTCSLWIPTLPLIWAFLKRCLPI